jgi:hypothetical protein
MALAMARKARGESAPPPTSPADGAQDAGGDSDGVGDEALDNRAWTAEQDGIIARSLHQGGWMESPFHALGESRAMVVPSSKMAAPIVRH